jgi:hypothetical protein
MLDSDLIIRFANRTVAENGQGSSTHEFRGRRPVGRRFRPTARRPSRAVERQQKDIGCQTLTAREASTIYGREGSPRR